LLSSAYLTDRQLDIWALNRRGLSQADIGRRLDTTRQAIYDALNIALGKVDSALRHAAEAGMIEPQYVDPKNGVLLGVTPRDRGRVIITFSRRHGVQTWHYEEPNCPGCSWAEKCRSRLVDEAEERGISLTPEERGLPPSRLAHVIFSRLIPGL